MTSYNYFLAYREINLEKNMAVVGAWLILIPTKYVVLCFWIKVNALQNISK